MDSYWNTLEALRNPTSTNMTALAAWVKQDALPWLWKELAGAILEPRRKHPLAKTSPRPATLSPNTEADAVRNGLFTSATDLKKKAGEAVYYQAQLTMLDAEATRYCTRIDTYSKVTN